MEFKRYKLGTIAKTSSGATPTSTKKIYYEGGTIPWINSGELSNPFIDKANNYITKLGFDNSSTKMYAPNETVLLAMYGATAGKAALLQIEACTNQAICAIIPDQSIVDPLFLKYKLDTMYNYLVGLSSGSARDNLSQTGISNLTIDIPSLAIQKRISKVLYSLDRKIALNRAINKNLLSFRPFINFTDYLLQILYLMLGDESKKNIVYQHFFNPSNLIITSKKYIGKEEGKISPTKFIKEVYRYRFFFDYYILRIDGNGSYRLLSAEASEHDKLEQYEAMLYADSSRYTYYRWIPFILEYVSNGANSLDNEQLLSELKVHDSLINEHCETNFKNFSFGNFNNYYFRRLDYYLWEFFIDTKKDGELSAVIPNNCVIDDVAIKAIKDYKFHQYNSVEHFHPQSEKEQSIKWDDETSIHSFGNLALISNTFNSTQNDNSLEMKFARIEEQLNQNKIESIKLVLMYYSAQQKATNWTKELMEKHKELMVKFLENSYKI